MRTWRKTTMIWFQSLIGRLKTGDTDGDGNGGGKFQSLIGRLKTYIARFKQFFALSFQSLIGRLKTAYQVRFWLVNPSFNPS